MNKMKNVLLFFTLLIISFSVNAQDSAVPDPSANARISSFDYFVKQTNIISESRIPRDLKEMRLLDLIDRYQSWVQRDRIKEEMKEYDICLVDGSNCNRSKVIEYLDQIHILRSQRDMTTNFRKMSARENEDVDYQTALKIYKKVGHSRMGSKDMCNGNCDVKDQTVSRARKDFDWQYTGECRYFVTDKFVGWRFLCEKVRRAKDPNMDGKAEKAWKEENNVDRW